MSSTSVPVRYYVGLDVHRDTISACVYDATEKRYCDEQVFSAHKPKSLARFVESTRSKYGHFRCCYEASFSGTVLYDTLTEHGVDCAIIARFPSAQAIKSKPISAMPEICPSILDLDF